ncbi:MAG TPA: hypothetical protein IAC31_02335 [Candidatus Faecousia intestinigallinarum]|nr:hypothetical protein [Candidatus Faecousia intestinigallinarum]
MKTKKGIIVLLCIFALCFYVGVLIFYGYIAITPTEMFPNYQGVLIIPEVGISTPCVVIEDTRNAALMQFIVNRPNCAAILLASQSYVVTENTPDTLSKTLIIGDHNYQGFSKIENCSVGDQAIFLSKDGVEKHFIVTASFRGHNYTQANGGFVDEAGHDVVSQNPGGIILYTCLDSSENVQIVFLQPVER